MNKKNQLAKWNGKSQCKKLQKRFGDYDEFIKKGGNKENKKNIFKIVNNLLEQHDNQLVLLDVGCGPGHFLWAFKDKVSKLIGLDYSKNMLNLAKEQLDKHNIETEFIEGSCWELPLSDDYADILLQVDVCMYIGRSWESIREMIRVSKKYIVFTGPSFENFDNTMDKQIAEKSFAVSIPLLKKELEILQRKNIIGRYEFLERPRTKTYNHKILFVEKY